MKLFSISAIATAVVIAGASLAQAATFTFYETVDGVRMSSSGEIDLNGLVLSTEVNGWGGSGVERNTSPETDIMGDTTLGGFIDRTYLFNDGTDASAWVGDDGPFDSNFFGFNAISGGKVFTTYGRANGLRVPGIGVDADDIVNGIWAPDVEWLAAGATFASTGLVEGNFTVTDARSGESISIIVGERVATVPLPATLPLLLSVLGGMGVLRSRRKSA